MIDLLQLRDFLQDNDAPDEILNTVAETAISLVESYLGYSLAYGEYTETFEGERVIYLSHAPIREIISVKDGEIEVTDYSFIKKLGIVRLNQIPAGVVEVRYWAGYETSELIFPLRSALFIIAQAVYQNVGSFGAKKESVQGYSVEYIDRIPAVAEFALRPYIRPPKLI
jgi:hypothetical protein